MIINNTKKRCLVIGRLIAVLVLFLIANSTRHALAENPRMRCEPQTIKARQTLTVHMPMPHGGELGVWTPENKFFFIAFEPEQDIKPPIPMAKFKNLRMLKINTASAVGLESISRNAVPEHIFTVSGKYRFIVSNNLETEDEEGHNLICDVDFKR